MATLVRRFVSLVAHVIGRSVEEFRKLNSKVQVVIVASVLLLFVVLSSSSSSSSSSSNPSLGGSGSAISEKPISKAKLKVLTWNTAAINNNPFEYWLTLKDYPRYDDMMNKVEAFVLEPPAKRDQVVSALFTDEMWARLEEKMIALKWTNVDKVKEMYVNEWSKRRTISEFLKDPTIGKKRLVSMPDRITNTIITSKGTFYRPTPINCYNGEKFGAINTWFDKWLEFMFNTPVTEDGKVPAQLLEKIPRAKYPALTVEEEEVSIPLQTLIIAIFDGIQVRMLNGIAGAEEWQNMRDRICTNLNRKKSEKTLAILRKSYGDANVMFLQETAAAFIDPAKDALGDRYIIVSPAKLGSNDQNSLIFLNRRYFVEDSIQEVTDEALAILKRSKSPVVAGDLLVIRVKDVFDRSYFLASFHGDTNGLATIPVVKAVREVFQAKKDENERFIFGMDANTYEHVEEKTEYQDVTDFATFFVSDEHLTSCWGNTVNPKKHTTRNARTYMQPQLSKAASKGEIEAKGDANPKDFVLFEPDYYRVELVARDNTGTGGFIEGMVFPTLEFPSDHAILRVVLGDKTEL